MGRILIRADKYSAPIRNGIVIHDTGRIHRQRGGAEEINKEAATAGGTLIARNGRCSESQR